MAADDIDHHYRMVKAGYQRLQRVSDSWRRDSRHIIERKREIPDSVRVLLVPEVILGPGTRTHRLGQMRPAAIKRNSRRIERSWVSLPSLVSVRAASSLLAYRSPVR